MTTRLQELRQKWKALLIDHRWAALFEDMARTLAPGSPSLDALALQQARHNKIHRDEMDGLAARDEISLAYNGLVQAMLDLIGRLEEEDLTGTPAPGPTRPRRMTPEEQAGIERAMALKVRVINKLRETLALEDDPLRSIRYEEQLRAAEAELKTLQEKLA